MEFYEYVKPELLSLLPVLYLMGAALKRSAFADWKIPFALGGTGVLLANVWLLAAEVPQSAAECVKLFACGAVQGLICAGTAVYAHNLFKQYKKKDGEDG